MGRRLEGNIGKYTGGGKSSRSLEMWRGESIRGTSSCGHSIVRKAKRLHSAGQRPKRCPGVAVMCFFKEN